jgi:hypothetical membrane protein
MMTVRTPTSTRLLLASGVIAGPFFTLAWLLESSTRSDYDPMRHPISSLSIGAHGWTQSVAFIVTGLLMIAFAIGLRRVLLARGRFVWAPRLIAAIGVGLLGAGFFVADPSNGYPLGTPALPLQYTLPGRLHRLFSALVFLGIPLASFNLARRFAQWGDPGWAAYSRVTGIAFVAAFVLTTAGFVQAGGLAPIAGLLQRVALTIGFVWLTTLALHMMKPPGQPPERVKPGP